MKINFKVIIQRLKFSLLLTSLFFSASVYSQNNPGYGNNRKLLLRDEGLSQISYVDLANPKANWFVKVPPGRDMQLIGDGLVLISTGNGYQEHEISTGKMVKEVASYPGTVMVRKLRNGNTLIVGLNSEGKKGIVLNEVDEMGISKKILNFPQFDYVRLVRETNAGTYLLTANKLVFESDASGKIIWKANITGGPALHTNAWQALRLANGQTVVSCGYSPNFEVFAKDGQLIKTITGPKEVNPNFFAGFQVLANGNYVVANWQGHGPTYGASGNQVLEYSPEGKLIWSWKQYADKFSSLQGVLVLDGLNTKNRYIEGKKGTLKREKN